MISEHPDKSEELLRQAGVTDNAWLDAVRQHHEFMDGAGYPQGLKGEAISRLARVIKLADIYCALVSGRAYRTAMLQNSAMRELFMQRGKQVDGQLTEQFVKVVGIYPPGTFVRLANAEIAVATRHGASASAPMVQSVVGPRGSPLAVYGKRDCGKADFAIREVISKAQANVKINRHMLWGYE